MDSIGDFLTVIRNGLMISKRSVSVPFSKMKMEIARVLKEEGYIKDYKQDRDENEKPILVVYLKYVSGAPAISEIKRISKLGRRHYEGVRRMRRVIGGLGIAILSTNKGIMTDRMAKKLSVGGEVICHVW